jgi:hypothetical protein
MFNTRLSTLLLAGAVFASGIAIAAPRDRTPPTTPSVSLGTVGPTYVTLSWSSTDNQPYIFYDVMRDGVPIVRGIRDTTRTFALLDSETTYSFTVRARDSIGNWSPTSAPLLVTTAAFDANDVEAPTKPGNLTDFGMTFEDGETWLFWEQSTDNVDPQNVIRYDVYVNGVFDQSIGGTGRTILYGNAGESNTFNVIALDSAGNASEPASVVLPQN